MKDQSQMRRLFAEYLSGEISTDDLETLENALSTNSDLRMEFIEYLNIDSALSENAALSQAELAELDQVQRSPKSPTPSSTTSRSWKSAMMILTGTIVASILIFSFVGPSSPAEENVASIANRVDASLSSLDNGIWKRTDLLPGRYLLKRGFLHLSFRKGVTVFIEAPAKFEAINEQKIALETGRISVNVPPAGIGFTVITPEAEVVDFGTEFSIDVDGGASEVHVFNGLVRVQPRTTHQEDSQAIDLRTAQAVRIEQAKPAPVNIELAKDRFVRNFKEPASAYPASVIKMNPVAYYRMPIRNRGLVCLHADYHGEVLTDENAGTRPAHAKGFIGGSLRIQADSIGRGGFVRQGPPVGGGNFSVVAFVFAEGPGREGTIVTNLSENDGQYSLRLNAEGFLTASVRTAEGHLESCASPHQLPLKSWQQVVMTFDGEELRLYENAEIVATTEIQPSSDSQTGSLWFGTNSEGTGLWDGRLDEVALFDRVLDEAQVAKLFKSSIPQPEATK